jgi:magnesium transporter
LFRSFKIERVVDWLNLIDEDDVVDILLTFSRKKRDEILLLLNKEKQKKVHYLLDLAKTPIGNVLTSEFLTVKSTSTVREVISKIKKETADFYYLNPIYVVNNEDQLIGVFNLHELIMQDLDVEVYKFMLQNLIVLHLTSPKEIVLRKFLKYKLYILPVIDSNKKILGVVSLHDLVSLIPGKKY